MATEIMEQFQEHNPHNSIFNKMWLQILNTNPRQLKNTRPNKPVQEELKQLQLHQLYSTILHCPKQLDYVYLDKGNPQILMTWDDMKPFSNVIPES